MVDIRLFFNQLFPRRCPLCGQTGHGFGYQSANASRARAADTNNQSSSLCQHCLATLPWIGRHCRGCALPLDAENQDLCGRCQQHPPPWSGVQAMFAYRGAVPGLVSGIKYRQQLQLSHELGNIWAEYLSQSPWSAQADVIVPIPLHWRRRWRRGFNQVAELAKPVSRALAVPLCHHCLRRVRFTPSQAQLPRRVRLHNLRNAFCSDAALVTGKHILLLDDVMTTGATLREATRSLLDAGAHRVDVQVLARTDDYR